MTAARPTPGYETALSPVMSLRQVSKRFGNQPVLENVDLDIYPGETVVFIGESGCGKSVTMKLLMALLTPDSGSVFWNGNDLRDWSRRRIRSERLRYGYLFQGAALFDSETVFDNIAFGLRRNTRFSRAEIRKRVTEQVLDVGLSEDVLKKRPAQLSGGMKKRVGLARAMVLEPQVMFYDEPTTGLDPVMSSVIDELILRASQRRKMTGIVVTHDMRTVERVAHRVVMFVPRANLLPGWPQVIFNGSPADLFACPDPRVAGFVRGDPSLLAA